MNQLITFILYPLHYWPYSFVVIATLALLCLIAKAYKNNNTRRMVLLSSLIPLLIVTVWLFIGFVMTPSLADDAEYNPQFFLKKYPTLQIKFRDFYLDSGDIAPFSRMLPTAKQQIANYCSYRYGFSIINDETLKLCINAIHPEVDLENPNG